jgi:hypothetical protein
MSIIFPGLALTILFTCYLFSLKKKHYCQNSKLFLLSTCQVSEGGGDPANTVPKEDDKTKLVGRDTEMKELKDQIDEVSRVISVWGIAGVGKSALVRSAYNQYLDNLAIFTGLSMTYLHGWVNVPHPFNLREFCRTLVLNLTSKPAKIQEDAAAELANMTNPVDVCHRLLSDDEEHKRCLIVIDDLQTIEEWDTIKQELSFGKFYCVILVTNESSVAKHCSGQDQDQLVFNVKGLADDDAYQLFDKVLTALK